ncbi:MAG: Acg family FMN-binding oxidoreductase [Terracidiphilus sp.]
MKRRLFLKSAGAVSVLAVGGGVWRACDQGVFSVGKGPAYEPWKDWRTQSGNGPLALVRSAILAASPHNTQPWLFRITPASIELLIDTGRNVGALDPYLREEHIGIGCALENLMLAAAANGYQATATLFSGKLEPIPAQPGPQFLARVDLAAGNRVESELYDAIPRRHTNRSAFLPQIPIPDPFIVALRDLPGDDPDVRIFLFTVGADRKRIAGISSSANEEIYADPEVTRASHRWIRTRWSDVQKYRDGLTIDAFGLSTVATDIAKMMSVGMLERAASRGQKIGYSDLMLSAPLIGILAVRDRYDRQDCLRAGRIWQQAHLLATARGLAARPCNEAVEMIDYEKSHGRQPLRAGLLAEIMGDAEWQPTFVFYMGYPTLPARTSPRRPIEDAAV